MKIMWCAKTQTFEFVQRPYVTANRYCWLKHAETGRGTSNGTQKWVQRNWTELCLTGNQRK